MLNTGNLTISSVQFIDTQIKYIIFMCSYSMVLSANQFNNNELRDIKDVLLIRKYSM